MLKALIFDFDGLILDTETPEYEALNEAYHEFGQHLPITTYGQVVGSEYNQEFEPLMHLQKLAGKELDYGQFWDAVNKRRFEIIDHAPILPGVENLIREAQARGLKLAVASSSPHQWVDRHLKRVNLFELFDAIICREDASQVKPAPDLFLAALKVLHLQAGDVVVFEDSRNGVIAARRAGIRVVLVPNPVTEHLKIEGETFRLRSLADLPLAELINRLDV